MAGQSTRIQLPSPHTTPPNFHLQSFRVSVERGAASLLAYLSSVEVRGDTKLSLGIGLLAGVAIVAAIAAYPGKPIDYTGVGESLWVCVRGIPALVYISVQPLIYHTAVGTTSA